MIVIGSICVAFEDVITDAHSLPASWDLFTAPHSNTSLLEHIYCVLLRPVARQVARSVATWVAIAQQLGHQQFNCGLTCCYVYIVPIQT